MPPKVKATADQVREQLEKEGREVLNVRMRPAPLFGKRMSTAGSNADLARRRPPPQFER